MAMKAYQHILVALDLSKISPVVARRGVELARLYGASVALVHVVEYLPTALDAEFALPPLVDVERQLMEQARGKLHSLAASVGLQAADCYIVSGSAKHELVRLINERHIDLVVVGSHARHGLARLVGSTTHGLIQLAACDVLAVYVAPE